MGATYLGDFLEHAVVHHKCSTNDAGGAAIDPSVDGVIRVWKDDDTTERTSADAEITYTVAPFDSKTGLIHVTVDTSGHAFYAKGHEFQIVLTGATVDGEAVLAVLAEFSIENRTGAAAYDRLGAPAGASVSADIAAIEAYVDEIESRLTAARAGYLDKMNISGNVAGATDLTAVKNKTDNLPADPAAVGDEMDLVNAPNATALAAIVAAIRAAVIDGVAWEDHVAITSASAAGDLSGAATNEQKITQLNGSDERIKAKTDQYGNRAITLTLP